MTCKKRYGRIFFVFLLLFIAASGHSFALRLWGEEDEHRKYTVKSIIPDKSPVRYESRDMMIFEKFVDKQSRRALRAFAEPDQQAAIFHFNSTEFLLIETARLHENRPVVIIPVPSEPEIFEGNQDMNGSGQGLFPEISNNVFYRLFNKYHIMAPTYDNIYEHEKIEPEEIIKQRKEQEEKAAGISLTVDISALKSEKQLKIHEMKVNQVLVLKSGDASEFINFFNRNFYKISPSQKPVIEHYIKKNWQFVIIRVKNPMKGEINPPVMLKFNTSEPVFPLEYLASTTEKRALPILISMYLVIKRREGKASIKYGRETKVMFFPLIMGPRTANSPF